ncbi:MAG: metal ABC transporter substrate-binding protein [Clostridiales bacterium]|nr:metal ABC transporter substrate-binding protein [Clostridiales bacterium]
MRRIVSFIAVGALAVVFGLSGCGRGESADPEVYAPDEALAAESQTPKPDAAADENRISVVATIFAPFDFARVVAGGRANVAMLLSPGMESHSYEPTPQDIITIQNADVFVYIGGESDAWVDRILGSMDTDNMEIVALVDCVTLVEEEFVEGMEGGDSDDGHGHSHDHGNDSHDGDDGDEVAYDEHVWTSPKNAMLIVQRIADALSDAESRKAASDQTNAAAYQANATTYIEGLGGLDAAFRTVTDTAVRHTIVFGDRFPFRYLTDEYGLDYFAAFSGCSTDTEPSARTVAFLIDKIMHEEIPVVFHIELSNERMADTISAETGTKKLLLHACHNITRDDFEAGLGYMDLMIRNVDALREALH